MMNTIELVNASCADQPESRLTTFDIQMIDNYHNLKEEQQKRLMAYMEVLKKIEDLENI